MSQLPQIDFDAMLRQTYTDNGRRWSYPVIAPHDPLHQQPVNPDAMNPFMLPQASQLLGIPQSHAMAPSPSPAISQSSFQSTPHLPDHSQIRCQSNQYNGAVTSQAGLPRQPDYQSNFVPAFAPQRPPMAASAGAIDMTSFDALGFPSTQEQIGHPMIQPRSMASAFTDFDISCLMTQAASASALNISGYPQTDPSSQTVATNQQIPFWADAGVQHGHPFGVGNHSPTERFQMSGSSSIGFPSQIQSSTQCQNITPPSGGGFGASSQSRKKPYDRPTTSSAGSRGSPLSRARKWEQGRQWGYGKHPDNHIPRPSELLSGPFHRAWQSEQPLSPTVDDLDCPDHLDLLPYCRPPVASDYPEPLKNTQEEFLPTRYDVAKILYNYLERPDRDISDEDSGEDTSPLDESTEKALIKKREARRKTIFTQKSYERKIAAVMEEDNGVRAKGSRNSKESGTAKKFEVVAVDHEPVLLWDGKPVATVENFWEILKYCHENCKHGGRDKTHTEVQGFFSLIPKDIINGYVKKCQYCRKKPTSTAPEASYERIRMLSLVCEDKPENQGQKFDLNTAKAMAMKHAGYIPVTSAQKRQKLKSAPNSASKGRKGKNPVAHQVGELNRPITGAVIDYAPAPGPSYGVHQQVAAWQQVNDVQPIPAACTSSMADPFTFPSVDHSMFPFIDPFQQQNGLASHGEAFHVDRAEAGPSLMSSRSSMDTMSSTEALTTSAFTVEEDEWHRQWVNKQVQETVEQSATEKGSFEATANLPRVSQPEGSASLGPSPNSMDFDRFVCHIGQYWDGEIPPEVVEKILATPDEEALDASGRIGDAEQGGGAGPQPSQSGAQTSEISCHSEMALAEPTEEELAAALSSLNSMEPDQSFDSLFLDTSGVEAAPMEHRGSEWDGHKISTRSELPPQFPAGAVL
ncbi:hypothetical protein BD324DRAFT_636845 [Kockovaella imperatae]|uniref:Integrase zinc-binding domain-containing protein n=1 Tax=Kockovaella imperatae TaxID=4999 RepID=A0A1Y1UAN8_9TREE|nr:hypothetical protein BD324DRAFT_636845 [Kockovaella imperatae]ORX34145.1 hypothetical protein BD324DRAFT_636845 [Kockovaella imperatae]